MNNQIFKNYAEIGISISPEGKLLLDRAWNRLKLAGNDVNGIQHSIRMSDNFCDFLQKNQEMIKNIDCESIIISIYCHDLWKASENKKSLFWLIKSAFDGFYSAKIFRKESLEVGLDEKRMKMTVHIISNHSLFSLGRKCIEDRMFHDLDVLDGENTQRKLQKIVVSEKNFILKLAYLFHSILPQSYYFAEIERLRNHE